MADGADPDVVRVRAQPVLEADQDERLVPKAVADELADLLQRSLHLSPVVTMTEIEAALTRYQEAVDRAA